MGGIPILCARTENLSWTHHERVAARTDRLAWLDRAAAGKWSVRRMLAEISEADHGRAYREAVEATAAALKVAREADPDFWAMLDAEDEDWDSDKLDDLIILYGYLQKRGHDEALHRLRPELAAALVRDIALVSERIARLTGEPPA
jgi:hypothetical protein